LRVRGRRPEQLQPQPARAAGRGAGRPRGDGGRRPGWDGGGGEGLQGAGQGGGWHVGWACCGCVSATASGTLVPAVALAATALTQPAHTLPAPSPPPSPPAACLVLSRVPRIAAPAEGAEPAAADAAGGRRGVRSMRLVSQLRGRGGGAAAGGGDSCIGTASQWCVGACASGGRVAGERAK
jgi:hypothetical protein